MEQNPIIEIKGVGKRYNINHRQGGYIALRDVIMDTLRSPFKFLKRKAREIAGMEIKEEFWALKDVSATIYKGEVIGIIGPNGSGKSTLLKILTGITPPTEGEIIMHGKVASLLEVGTGFHPELTGRENIFLNGAIIGMSKKEITNKFDEIVAFSGVEKFIDTPVKYYSSGMYVRLAFSVAAHMEPDILLIDEVLAVGDAEFQKKCLGKMEEVTKQAGRTILFVSHNMTAIKQLCDRTILLEKGSVKDFGETNKIIDEYLKKDRYSELIEFRDRKDRKGNGKIKLTKIFFKKAMGENTSSFVSGEEAQFWLEYECNDKTIKDFIFYLAIDSTIDSARITTISNKYLGQKIFINGNKNSGLIKISVNKLPLAEGEYYVTFFIEGSNAVTDGSGTVYDWIQRAAIFSVKNGNFYGGTGQIPQPSSGQVLFEYKIT